MTHIYVHTYFFTSSNPSSSSETWKLYPALLLAKLDCEQHGRKYKGRVTAVVAPEPHEIRVVNEVEHYQDRVSAHYWIYADEINKENPEKEKPEKAETS